MSKAKELLELFESKIKMEYNKETNSYFSNEYDLKREYGKTPNGNNFSGQWVLRDNDKKIITFNQYINDIASEYNLELNKR